LEKPYLLLIAGFRPVKDVMFLMDAMNRLHLIHGSRAPQLVIIGPTLDQTYFDHVSQKAVQTAGVSLSSPVSRAELLQLIRCSLAIVNSSISEGQSGALLEALALGVPVIARDIPGNRAVLELAVPFYGECCDAENTEIKGWSILQSGFLFSTPEGFEEVVAKLFIQRGQRNIFTIITCVVGMHR
jgi:glycosyltransferase involved in cell wall biosynthesis